jgi:hypothetical protein
VERVGGIDQVVELLLYLLGKYEGLRSNCRNTKKKRYPQYWHMRGA